MSPFISVITVVRNGAGTLEKTIASVLSQTYDRFEYIVIDGASSDGTLDILRKYDDRLKWISEPDSGIYEAMNKGLDLARGQWVYFLGADDYLAGPDVLKMVAPCLNGRLSLVFGSVRYTDGRLVASELGARTLLRNTLHHQGAFYNARLFETWRYDCNFKVVADYELNLLIYRRGQPYTRIAETIAVCGDLGLSLTRWRMAVAETNAIRGKHMGGGVTRLLGLIRGLEMLGSRLLIAWRQRKE